MTAFRCDIMSNKKFSCVVLTVVSLSVLLLLLTDIDNVRNRKNVSEFSGHSKRTLAIYHHKHPAVNRPCLSAL